MNTRQPIGTLSRHAMHQLTAHAMLAARCIVVALQDLNGLKADDAESARQWLSNDDTGGASFHTCCVGIANVQRYLNAKQPEGPMSLPIGSQRLEPHEAENPLTLMTAIRDLAALDDSGPVRARQRLKSAEQFEAIIEAQCGNAQAMANIAPEMDAGSASHLLPLEPIGTTPTAQFSL